MHLKDKSSLLIISSPPSPRMLNKRHRLFLLAIFITAIFFLILSPNNNTKTSPPPTPYILSFSHHRDNIAPEEIVNDNYVTLQNILQTPISEPKVPELVYNNDQSHLPLANATLMILAKNSDLKGVLHTMKQIESTFNSKFNYPYVFLNDGDFNTNFKDQIKKYTKATVYFEKIDPMIWNQPDWINSELQRSNMKTLQRQNIAYATKKSYHNMCRFYSRSFYNHPRMQQFKYYWRFEPNTDYYCQIDYDVFKFMESNNLNYGFTIALYDSEQTVQSLYTSTLEFLSEHPDYVHPNAAIDFITEDMQNPQKTKFTNGYSTCHFWSNFEIANMDFYRAKKYSEWVEYLESKGGFYYERWGDAPVHSLGVSLFADKESVHWFRDIGYKHHPYINAPNSEKCSDKFAPGDFTYDHLKDQNCITNWWNYEMSDKMKKIY